MTKKRALLLLAALGTAAGACSGGITAGNLPGAPTDVVAIAGVRSATVSWSAPAAVGGSAIAGYTVVPSPVAPLATIEVVGTAATVTGLANGTAYRFSVAARNGAGTGPLSLSSSSVTTPDLPEAPRNVAAAPGDRSAVISWNPPASDGGTAITGYGLTIAPAVGSASVVIQGTTASVSGLANGTAYTFGVHATNAVGDGPDMPSGAITPAVLRSISLIPSPLSVPVGGARQLLAVGTYDGGAQRDLTAQAQWASANPTVAAVSTGVVSGVAPGTTSVTASLGALSATAAVSVGVDVTALAIFPPAPAVPLDRAVQLAALATLSDGSRVMVAAESAWSSGSPGAIQVSGGKLSAASGAAAGATAVITATYGGVTSAPVTATLLGASTPIGPGYDNDPFVSQQWHLKNTGQKAFAQNAGIPGNDIGATASYRAGYGGRGVKVAVVDGGLEIAHEDLAGNIVPGSWNFVSSTSNPTSTATTGDHGTSVAGLVAAVRNNALGGVGVAPMTSLNGYNYMANQSTANFLAAMGAGTGVNGPLSDDVWVFNESFGVSTTTPFLPSSTREAQYLDGVTNLRGGLGAVYVKSAGNGFQDYDATTMPDCSASNAAHVSCENASMDPYNTSPMQVVVAALAANGKRASYSTAGASIWVSAPGGEFGLSGTLTCGGSPCPAYYFDPAMITTDQSGCAAGFATSSTIGSAFDAGLFGNTRCNYTNGFNGTSSAAPVVSGVVALLLEANPSLAWRDVKHILAATAKQVDAAIAPTTRPLSDGTYVVEPGWITNAAGRPFHDWYGFGAVDVDAAITMALGWVPGSLPPLQNTGWINGSIQGSGSIPDNSVAGATGTTAVAAAMRIESVQVRLSTDHAFLGDLGVELTSPSGTRSVLLNAVNGFGSNTGTVAMQLSSNAFLGESSAGTWTVRVVDATAGRTGRLVSWQLRVYGH